jgi:hypothetical protein
LERSFHDEIQALKLGAGQTFHGEGILAVTKALLQSGVTYVGGYQGSPISHLLDVMVQSRDYLDELGVHVEACTNESFGGRHAGRVHHVPGARRGHLEVGGRHQCRVRRAEQSGVARRDGRRARSWSARTTAKAPA